MTRWIKDCQLKQPGIQITYRSIGSGGGIQEYKKQFLGFAASDAPLSDNQVSDLFATIQAAAEELSYAKLPVSLQKLDQKLLGEMTADSQDVVRESGA
jgi:phosphate transport system substrate-binding protein